MNSAAARLLDFVDDRERDCAEIRRFVRGWRAGMESLLSRKAHAEGDARTRTIAGGDHRTQAEQQQLAHRRRSNAEPYRRSPTAEKLHEEIEDLLQLIWCNASSGIDNAEDDFVLVNPERHGEHAVCRRVFPGVAQEIRHHLAKPGSVNLYRHHGVR